MSDANMSDGNISGPLIRPSFKLTHAAALKLVGVAVEAATTMGMPQCIVIVDEGCQVLAALRMDGARVLSMESATHKAMTAASIRMPTGAWPSDKGMSLGLATGGKMVNLPGGLPLLAHGVVIGAVGIGSGTSEQDFEIAEAVVAAFAGWLNATASKP